MDECEKDVLRGHERSRMGEEGLYFGGWNPPKYMEMPRLSNRGALHKVICIILSLSMLWMNIPLCASTNHFIAPPGIIDNNIIIDNNVFNQQTPKTLVDLVLDHLVHDSNLRMHDSIPPYDAFNPSFDRSINGVDLGKYYSVEEAKILELILFYNKLEKDQRFINPHVFDAILYSYNHQIIPLIPISEYGIDDPIESFINILQGDGMVLRMKDGKVFNAAAVFGNITLDRVSKAMIVESIDFSDVLMMHNWIKLKRLEYTAHVAAALSFEARLGKLIELDPAIHDTARPHQGQIEVAAYMRSLLQDSQFVVDTYDVSAFVQDPYSYRGTPQVHGGIVDAIRYLKHMLVKSIHSSSARKTRASDSVSLVVPGDVVRVAASELGSIAERRVSILIDPNLSTGLTPFLTDTKIANPGLNSSFMITQYVQAALVSILKTLSVPLSFSLEQSAEYEIAKKLDRVIDYVEYVLAIELMVAAQAIDLRQAHFEEQTSNTKTQGVGTRKAFALVRKVSKHLEEDRALYKDVNAIKKQIQNGDYSRILSSIIGRPETAMNDFPSVVVQDNSKQVGIVLDGLHVSVDEIYEIANTEVPVDIAPGAYGRVRKSRKAVEDIIRKRLKVYGVTTGFGPHSETFVEPEQAEQLQLNLIRSHATGVGKHFDPEVVRAIMALRLNTLAKGLSGVRPIVIETFKALLNKGVIPAVPCLGSVGASGDLAPLSHLALVLVGEGEAYYDGELLSGAEALRKTGIEPIRLSYKEGLALNNGTPVMTALGILNLCKLEKLYTQLKMMGINNVFPAHMNTLESTLNYARRILTTETNSATDNPLIVNGKVYYGANFHGEPVGIALEGLRFATRQMSKMLIDSNLRIGSDKVKKRIIAIDTEIGSNSHPSVVDTIPTSLGVEDHVSMATNAGLLLNDTVPKLETIFSLFLVKSDLAMVDYSVPRVIAIHDYERNQVLVSH